MSTEKQAPAESNTESVEPKSSHAAPEGAGVHPLIDLSRDPTPGRPDHAKPDDE